MTHEQKIQAGIVVVYLILAGGFAFTKLPWCDEAWFASPAINLIEHGHMGTTCRELEGTYLTRMDQHTYWQPPLSFLSQAVWYSVFGVSLFSLRLHSVFWGLVLVLALYSMVSALTRNTNMALLAMGLTAIDFSVIYSAADGRMDSMCAALAFSGMAAYLCFRTHNLTLALLLGHGLACASGLTHPNGIMAVFGIVALNFLDRKQLQLKHLVVALIPYLVGGAAWALYVIQDPQAFADQLGGNMSGRFYGLAAPLTAIQAEMGRYMNAFGMGEGSSAFAKAKLAHQRKGTG